MRCRKHVLCDSGNLDISQSQMNMSANTAGQPLGYLKRRLRKQAGVTLHAGGTVFHVAQQAKLSSDCGCYPPSTVSLRLWAITESHSEIQWRWDTRGHTVVHVGPSLQNCFALTHQVRCWTQILRVICPNTPSSPEHHVAHSLSYD